MLGFDEKAWKNLHRGVLERLGWGLRESGWRKDADLTGRVTSW